MAGSDVTPTIGATYRCDPPDGRGALVLTHYDARTGKARFAFACIGASGTPVVQFVTMPWAMVVREGWRLWRMSDGAQP